MSKLRTSAASRAAALSSAGTEEPILELATQRFIDTFIAASGPPLYTLTPQAARKMLGEVRAGADGHCTASELLLKVSAAR